MNRAEEKMNGGTLIQTQRAAFMKQSEVISDAACQLAVKLRKYP